MLGRQQVYLELSDDMEEFDELTEIMSNTHLNNNFLALAREVRCLQLYVNYICILMDFPILIHAREPLYSNSAIIMC